MMDSKQLYMAAAHLSSTLTWDDWIHFGTGKEIKNELIEGFIDDFLADDIIHFVHARQDSGKMKRIEIKEKIAELAGQENFQLWNSSMTKAIDFNQIGVLKLGQK
jgi:hypothetical protein